MPNRQHYSRRRPMTCREGHISEHQITDTSQGKNKKPQISSFLKTLLSLEVATPEKKHTNPFDAVLHVQESPSHERFLVGMQPTLHPTRQTPPSASRLVQAVSAWSAKTRRPPSRHCRDASALWSYDYGHARQMSASPFQHHKTPKQHAFLLTTRRFCGGTWAFVTPIAYRTLYAQCGTYHPLGTRL